MVWLHASVKDTLKFDKRVNYEGAVKLTDMITKSPVVSQVWSPSPQKISKVAMLWKVASYRDLSPCQCSMLNDKPANSTMTSKGCPPGWVQTPRRLMMFTWRPICFIISISWRQRGLLMMVFPMMMNHLNKINHLAISVPLLQHLNCHSDRLSDWQHQESW